MSDDFINELRRRSRIEDVVGSRIEFDRAKSNPRKGDLWACCPFHGEKTPSFHVLTDKGTYHCFGCGVHGDVFSFVMEYENLGFFDAAKRLAGDIGMEVPERTPEAAAKAKMRRSLQDVMEIANEFYKSQLRSGPGEQAREYLKGRELERDIQDRFSLGYAPNQPDALLKYMKIENIDPEMLREVGLLARNDEGRADRDFFRNRIMFPVRDPEGRVIAFGGRALSPEARAKYMNSPATTLFDKSRVLYNMDLARKAIRDAGTLITVEGYMDVIALARAGINHSVAPMGTAMTEDHLSELWRLAPEPLICFDGDEAGKRAASRVVELALPRLQTGHSLKFVILPEGQDPDDLLRAGGAGAVKEAMSKASSLSDMIWQVTASTNTLTTPEGQAQFQAELDRLTGLIQENRSRQFFAQALNDRFYATIREARGGKAWTKGQGGSWSKGQNKGFVSGASNALKRSTLAQGILNPASGAKNPLKHTEITLGGRHREQLLLYTLVNHPGILESHIEAFVACEIHDPELKTLKTALFEAVSTHPGLDTEGLRGHFKNRGIGDIAARLAAQDVLKCLAFAQIDAEPKMAEEHWLEVLARHNTAAALLQDLQNAERAFVNERTEDNLERLRDVQNLLAKHERGEAVLASDAL